MSQFGRYFLRPSTVTVSESCSEETLRSRDGRRLLDLILKLEVHSGRATTPEAGSFLTGDSTTETIVLVSKHRPLTDLFIAVDDITVLPSQTANVRGMTPDNRLSCSANI